MYIVKVEFDGYSRYYNEEDHFFHTKLDNASTFLDIEKAWSAKKYAEAKLQYWDITDYNVSIYKLIKVE